MFCIDYPLSCTSWSRQTVFLINTEETVSESDGRELRGQCCQCCRRPGMWRGQHKCSVTTNITDLSVEIFGFMKNAALSQNRKGANGKCVHFNKTDGFESRNIISIAPWIKPGRKSISSGWLCSRAQPKQRTVYFESLLTSFIRARFISAVQWIHCAQRPGQGRVFSEAIFKWSNSSQGLSRPGCQ